MPVDVSSRPTGMGDDGLQVSGAVPHICPGMYGYLGILYPAPGGLCTEYAGTSLFPSGVAIYPISFSENAHSPPKPLLSKRSGVHNYRLGN